MYKNDNLRGTIFFMLLYKSEAFRKYKFHLTLRLVTKDVSPNQQIVPLLRFNILSKCPTYFFGFENFTIYSLKLFQLAEKKGIL